MNFDLQRILEGKRELRRNLAGRSVAEKLAMLDALRDRTRTIREAAARRKVAVLRDSPPASSSAPRDTG